MNTNEIRAKFLDFFKHKNHAIIPSAPLVPEHDPTVLFTTAGMHPLIPFLLGNKHPQGKRLANSQKCIRTVDIDKVGDNSHLTMFEMLGNWSLGDYYKAESIEWSFEFLTNKKWLGIDPHKLYITVYEGDAQVSEDTESIKIWQNLFQKVGLEAKIGERIKTRSKNDNWWEIGGNTIGPAGPDTEIYCYLGKEQNPQFNPNSEEFIEVWNNVFLCYQRKLDGSYTDLKQKNVDTGMGLERIAVVMQKVAGVFETDLLKNICNAIINHAGLVHEQVYAETDMSLTIAVRIIADHLRSAVFITADQVIPSNIERGYVLRRLVRRAIRRGLILGIKSDLIENIAPVIIKLYQGAYPELLAQKKVILDVLSVEEQLFRKTLDRGVKEFSKLVKNQLTGKDVFILFDTYGFPPELSIEDAKRIGITIDETWETDFKKLMEEQKRRSRTATAGVFRGGLADHSELTTKYHTATHLMYRALRLVLGDHVSQRGSNITAERARFDFSHSEKVTPEQIARVEEIVNEQIAKDLLVSYEEMSPKEAFAKGAAGAFGDKYGEIVKVYTIGDPSDKWFSKEICGGPHVDRTGVLGEFKIIKEESSSAGVRRIKAILK